MSGAREDKRQRSTWAMEWCKPISISFDNRLFCKNTYFYFNKSEPKILQHYLITHVLAVPFQLDFWRSKSLHCRSSWSIETSQRDISNDSALGVISPVLIEKIDIEFVFQDM